MSLFVECKPDETLARALGVHPRDIEHASGKAGVCAQLARRSGSIGMVDEDPGSVSPTYFKTLQEESWEHGIRVFLDKERKNRVIGLSPRLEEWLVRSAKIEGLNMTDFGFESDNGVRLHSEINERLGSLERLLVSLLDAGSQRILRLRSLILPG